MKPGLSVVLVPVLVLICAGVAAAGPMDEGLKLLGQGRLEEALAAFDRELKIRPANTQAYLYAGMTAEKIPDLKRASRYWESLLKVTADPDERKLAKVHLAECARKETVPEKPPEDTAPRTPASSFDFADDKFHKVTTKHFMVMAKNRALAQKAAEEGERHLRRICSAFLRGQMWPRVISVYIYRDHTEYVRERGLPDWSGGGYSYIRYSVDNQVRRVDLFQLGKKDKYCDDLLTKTLPHELTHVVMEEWFGERKMPLALNEGLAMYVEEGTHDDYEQSAARATAKGQYFHFEDLYRFQKYPPRPQIGLFYVQSASATRYLISHLSAEQFNRMMDALKSGQDMNSALCSATGRVGDLLGSVEANWVKLKKEVAAKLPEKKPKKPEKKDPIRETEKK